MRLALMTVMLEPGIAKLELARRVVPADPRNHGLRLVDRCIAAGLLEGAPTSGGRIRVKLTAEGRAAVAARLAS